MTEPRTPRETAARDQSRLGGRGAEEAGEPPSGSRAGQGQLAEAGPLGKVDPLEPVVPGTGPRPPSGLATLTVVVGFAAVVALLVVIGSVAQAVRAHEVFALDT